MENLEIKSRFKKYGIKYSEVLPYIQNRSHTGNFSHINRISEELAKPLSPERYNEYLVAIDKARIKRITDLEKEE